MTPKLDYETQSTEADLFLGQVYGLVDAGMKEEAADFVYDHFHELLSAGEYTSCDAIFNAAEPSRLGSSLSRSFLSLTDRDKKLFVARQDFFKRAFQFVQVSQDTERATRLLGHLAE